MIKINLCNNIDFKTSVYFNQNATECHFKNENSWIVLSDIAQSIRSKMESIGTPLKNWDINIYRGILTGFNDAFIITNEKREELISDDPKSAEIIRPILRGRDIKRYHSEFNDLWLINAHNGIKEKNIKPININDYPAIKEHLDKFYSILEKRSDKGDTPYNLRNCAYMDDFSKQKIIYPEITKFLNFYLDKKGYMTNNKCFILTGEYINFLTVFFNSSIFKFCYRDHFPELLGGSRELRKVFLEEIPVIRVNDTIENKCRKLLEELNFDLQDNLSDIIEQEKKLDEIIFDLYELNEQERKEIGFIMIQ